MSKNLKLLFGCGGLAGLVLVLLACCSVGLLMSAFGAGTDSTAASKPVKLVRLPLPTLTPTLLPTDTPTFMLPVPAPVTPIATAAPEIALLPTLSPADTPTFMSVASAPATPTATATPEATLTPTLWPTDTPTPAAAPTIAEAPPVETATPTEAAATEPVETATPTEVVVTEPPTETPAPSTPAPMFSSCNCSGDVYDCDSFDSWNEAQACFEYCQGAGVGDTHKLDEDHDYVACENLR